MFERGVTSPIVENLTNNLHLLVDEDPHMEMDRIAEGSTKRKFRLMPCRTTKTRDSGWDNN